MNKLPVHLSKFVRSRTAFERLRFCHSCQSYSALELDNCSICGNAHSTIPFMEYVHILSKRGRRTELFACIAVMMLAVCVSRTLLQIGLSLLFGAAFLFLLVKLNRRYGRYADDRLLRRLLLQDTGAIHKGLLLDLDLARKDTQMAKYKEAYEKLREAGVFLQNDRVKIRKIMCLNHFIIRKDMDLELETLVPDSFDKDFILYLREAVRVNKQLVRANVLHYVLSHRDSIEEMDIGREVMALVMGAALRMKGYIHQCQHVLAEYADELPKERFLRLCKIVAADSSFWDSHLYLKCKESVKTHYGFDPDFHGLF